MLQVESEAHIASFLASPGKSGQVESEAHMALFLASPGRIQQPHQSDECSSKIKTQNLKCMKVTIVLKTFTYRNKIGDWLLIRQQQPAINS
jgi:hypothetical protein